MEWKFDGQFVFFISISMKAFICELEGRYVDCFMNWGGNATTDAYEDMEEVGVQCRMEAFLHRRSARIVPADSYMRTLCDLKKATAPSIKHPSSLPIDPSINPSIN